MNISVSGIDPRETAMVEDLAPPTGIVGPSHLDHDPGNLVMAMIVCSICKHAVYSPVDCFECDHLVYGGQISRHCHNCEAPTNWVQFEWHRPDAGEPLLYQTTQPDRV